MIEEQTVVLIDWIVKSTTDYIWKEICIFSFTTVTGTQPANITPVRVLGEL